MFKQKLSSVCSQNLPNCLIWNVDKILFCGNYSGIAVCSHNCKYGSIIVQSIIYGEYRFACISNVKCSDQLIVAGDDLGKVLIINMLDHSSQVVSQLNPDLPVTALSAVSISNNVYVASAFENQVLEICHRVDGTMKPCFHDSTAPSFILDVSLTFLDKVLFCLMALDNGTIRLLAQQSHWNTVHTFLGHQDWVRVIACTSLDGVMFVASGSQDEHIRLWSITTQSDPSKGGSVSDLHHINSAGMFALMPESFSIDDIQFSVTLESVMSGHNGWITGLNWNSSGTELLSCSIDRTLIIWAADSNTGVWLEQSRIGEYGGNSLGFWGCTFSPDNHSILATGFRGSLHLWANSDDEWKSGVIPSGHFGPVVDLSWNPQGEFLLTAGLDQTVRCFAPVSEDGCWHEIARPQIHGHDMQCLTFINRFRYASGSEEKIIRVFEAPATFIGNLEKLCSIPAELDEGSLPQGAGVPTLGLSNKAIETEHSSADVSFTPIDLARPPCEETLLQHTLWPEMSKLYGHGYDVFSMHCSPDGTFLASSCKSSKADHASIIIWDTAEMNIIDKLTFHSLTVTQLRFSHDSRYLLAVSRDRTWSLYERNTNSFHLVAYTDKKTCVHSRIIWSCAWAHDDRYFATSSRDKKLLIWCEDEGSTERDARRQYKVIGTLKLPHSAMSVDFASVALSSPDKYLLGCGLDDGYIHLYSWAPQEGFQLISSLKAHHAAIRKLMFSPGSLDKLLLATAGDDAVVTVFEIVN